MDEVLLGKAAIIERCLKRIDEEYRELDLDVVRGLLSERLTDLKTFAQCLVKLGLPHENTPDQP